MSINAHNEPNLTRRQEQAVLALLTHSTLRAAAEAADVSLATLVRWQQLPVFQAAVVAARRDVMQQTTTTLTQRCTVAVDTLQAIMTDSTASASARISAARTVLEYAYRGVELDDLAARVTAIEAAVTGGDPYGTP